ncbi:MAG: hypothetical protein WC501_05310 [Candidatus Micrarchaeia archaeon]
MEFNFILERKFDLGQKEINELVLYTSLAFIFPLIFGHLAGLAAQIFIGATVNFFLVLSAFYVSGWKNIFVVVIPSMAAYFSGIVFGASSAFLLYFIPAIWIGNAIFVYFIKKSMAGNTAYGVLKSSILKAGFLFTTAIFFVYSGIVPQMFLVAMGPVQLATALLGGFFGLVFHSIRKR